MILSNTVQCGAVVFCGLLSTSIGRQFGGPHNDAVKCGIWSVQLSLNVGPVHPRMRGDALKRRF